MSAAKTARQVLAEVDELRLMAADCAALIAALSPVFEPEIVWFDPKSGEAHNRPIPAPTLCEISAIIADHYSHIADKADVLEATVVVQQ